MGRNAVIILFTHTHTHTHTSIPDPNYAASYTLPPTKECCRVYLLTSCYLADSLHPADDVAKKLEYL